MKKILTIIAGCLLVAGFVACSDAKYDHDNEITSVVTVGDERMVPDLWDTVFYVSKTQLAAYNLKKGDRAMVNFTVSWSASGGAVNSFSTTINKVLMTIPVAEVTVENAQLTASHTSAVPLFYHYCGYPMWMQGEYLNVGLNYTAASEGNFVLTADTVRSDTACFKLYSQIPSGNTTTYGQYYSFDLSKCASLAKPSFVSAITNLDSMYVRVTTKYQYSTDSIINLSVYFPNKVKRPF